MRHDTLNIAMEEAERFLAKAKALKEAINTPREQRERWEVGVESAAVKRSSMDLTRALAQLRKRNR